MTKGQRTTEIREGIRSWPLNQLIVPSNQKRVAVCQLVKPRRSVETES